METPANSFEMLFEKAENYARTTYQLSKLTLLETSSTLAIALFVRLIVVLMISMFVLIASIGVAVFLGGLLNHMYYGFFIVAAFYLILGLVSALFLHAIINKPVSELIIKKALQ